MPLYMNEGANRVCSDVNLNRQFLEIDDEEKAYKLLFDRYYRTVLNYVTKMMWDHPDPAIGAEDIASETLIIALNKRKEIQKPERLVGWLLTVARNRVIDSIRTSERRTRPLSTQSLDNLSVEEKELPFASTLAEADAAEAETRQYLMMRVFRLLPERDREIVELRLDELSPKEIAAAIDSTAGAVQKRWGRLIAWLGPVEST